MCTGTLILQGLQIQMTSTNGPDSSFSIATSDLLNGPAVRIPVRDEIFRTPPDRTLNPPNLLYNAYWVCFPGVHLPGLAEVKEKSYTSPLPLGFRAFVYGDLCV